ncbi:copper resistance D family protein [Actinokineospora globicatena]|uniref:copper resistance D family protein n=1 Tax=Actinokineospora globicatena TaxID=103729 RepID=UPI0020A31720|nr:CopD family protein [Actinokineospora globicatena]MCP2301214.1 putative copper resistance protein D [Actinokineospora globicatena]GLW77150.1 copper resistance protein CopD [Actinokineospora globicatena]GLW83984.1 copper resistance protein CopD [Actinokineospora globicatena]
MTTTRTTTYPGIAAVLVVSAIVGVLVGLAVTAAEPVPGLPEPAVVVRVGLPVVRVLLDMAAVTTVGLCLLPLLIGFDRPKLAEPVLVGARRVAMLSALVWAVAALVALVLQTAELRPGKDVSAAAVWDYVGTVGAGKALLFVAAFALLSFALSLWSVRVGESVPAELRAAVSLFALLPLPVTGHATNWRWHDLTMISMELHVMSAAAWTGGLGAVVVLLAANRTLLAHALPRFSKLATICLVVVALTGVFNGAVELAVNPHTPLFEALVSTRYGVLVLLKLGCLVALAALGAKIRWRLLPAITAHRGTALVAWAGVELAIMGLAFGFAVVLTRAPVS